MTYVVTVHTFYCNLLSRLSLTHTHCCCCYIPIIKYYIGTVSGLLLYDRRIKYNTTMRSLIHSRSTKHI